MTGSIKVLIVEDYADISNLYSIVFQKAGYEVRVAGEGKEALAQILSYKPDLILLDIMIPDIDGLEILKTIRTSPKYQDQHPLVLVATNVIQEDITDKATQYGADGYVVKANVDNHDLLKIVEELLEKRNKPDNA